MDKATTPKEFVEHLVLTQHAFTETGAEYTVGHDGEWYVIEQAFGARNKYRYVQDEAAAIQKAMALAFPSARLEVVAESMLMHSPPITDSEKGRTIFMYGGNFEVECPVEDCDALWGFKGSMTTTTNAGCDHFVAHAIERDWTNEDHPRAFFLIKPEE